MAENEGLHRAQCLVALAELYGDDIEETTMQEFDRLQYPCEMLALDGKLLVRLRGIWQRLPSSSEGVLLEAAFTMQDANAGEGRTPKSEQSY